ncbi:MAG: hypothetical protein ACOY0S_03290 [Patescibacteria group bacterium]
MRIKAIVASVVGKTNEREWGQVLLSPDAYGVIEVADIHGEARQRGVEILSRLTAGLAQAPKSLKEVADLAQSLDSKLLRTLLLLVPVGNVVYLVLRGKGAVYLKREEKVACLMEAPGEISGEVAQGDTLLLASQGFTQVFTARDLTGVFDHLAPSEVSEKLTLLLHEKDGVYGSAALIFQVAELVSPENEELVPSPKIAPSPTRPALWRRPLRGRITHLAQALPLPLKNRLRAVKHRLVPGGRINRLGLLVTLILIVLFGVSVVLGLRRQAAERRSQVVTQALAQAQHAFDEGVALLPLSPVKGRERLLTAREILASLTRSVNPRSGEGRELAALYQKVTDNLTQAMQIVRASPQLFFEASLLKKGATITHFSLVGDALGMVDGPGKAVYVLSVESKKAEIIAGGELYQGASQVAVLGDKLYTLVEAGIHAARTSDKKTLPLVIKKDPEWNTIKSLVAYGGNLYLLDTGKSRIWKYVATETGFSPLREYLNPDTLPNLQNATSMAIDGSVWVGTTSGKFWRFTAGRENTFIPQGVEPALGDNLVVATSDTVKNLYVLDSQNRRVVVLDKDGTYLAQYVWEGNFNPQDLVVSERHKKILLLSDGKIYALDLK